MTRPAFAHTVHALGCGAFVVTVSLSSGAGAQGTGPDQGVEAKAEQGSTTWLRFLPTSARVDESLPIYVTVDHLPEARTARLFYKSPGEDTFRELEMDLWHGAHSSDSPSTDRGFAAAIPCIDLQETGTLQLYIVVADLRGGLASSAGSASTPVEIAIVSDIPGPAARFPDGELPEDECPRVFGNPPCVMDDPPTCGAPRPPVREQDAVVDNSPKASTAGCASCQANSNGRGSTSELAFLTFISVAAVSRLRR